MGFDILPPWEANRWFQLPTVEDVNMGLAAPVQIVSADPMRVGLMFLDHNGGNTKWIYSPSPTVSATSGHQYPQGSVPVEILHKDWGPLVQGEWWGFAPTGNVVCTVVSLALRDWPEPDPHRNVDVQDYLAEIAEFIRGIRNAGAATR